MHEIPPEQPCEKQIREIVSDLFRTMLQMEVSLIRSQACDHERVVTAKIDFIGEWDGVLELSCSHAQAVCFAQRFLQMPVEEFNQEVHDTVGELANIIAGNLKPNLPKRVALGSPTVVLTSDGVAEPAEGRVVGAYSFTSEGGAFWIRIVQKNREESKQ